MVTNNSALQALTRRDQLAKKPAKGRGRGKGRGKGRGNARGKKSKSKSKVSMDDDGDYQDWRENEWGNWEEIPHQDDENDDDDAMEDHVEKSAPSGKKPKGKKENKKSAPSSKASAAVPKAASPKPAVKPKATACKSKPAPKAKAKSLPSGSSRSSSSARRERLQRFARGDGPNFNETKIAKIMEFVNSVDYKGLEWDDMKWDVSQKLPTLHKTRLNKYWSRRACGITYKGHDVKTLSVHVNMPGTPSMKCVVAVGLALQLATLLHWFKLCFQNKTFCSGNYSLSPSHTCIPVAKALMIEDNNRDIDQETIDAEGNELKLLGEEIIRRLTAA